MTTNVAPKANLGSINKIKRLANKKGTPLIKVSFNRKSIHFEYKSGVGVIGFSYSSRSKGIAGEIRRLEH